MKTVLFVTPQTVL